MVRSGVYNLAGAGLRAALALLTIPLLIRALGVEEYGLWMLASAVVGIVALAEAGLPIATTVFVSRDLANGDAAGLSHTLSVTFGAMLALATAAGVVLIAFGPVIAGAMPNLQAAQRDALGAALRIGGVVIWARLLQQVLIGVEQAYNRFGPMNVLNTLQVALTTLGLVGVAWLGGRTVAMMAWSAAAAIVVLGLHAGLGWRLLRGAQVGWAWSRAKFREVAGFSALTWATNLGGVMFSQVDRVIVGALLGPAGLGAYAAITSIAAQVNTFSALSVQPVLPRISAAIAREETGSLSLRRTLKKAFATNFAVVLVVGVTLIAAAPLIVALSLSEGSSPEAVTATRLAVAIYMVYSLNAVGYYVLFAAKAVAVSLAVNLASGMLALTLIAVLAASFGLIGAIAGNVGYALSLLFVPLALRELKIPFLPRSVRSSVAG